MASIKVPATYLGASSRKRRMFFPRAKNGWLILTEDQIAWEPKRVWGLSPRAGFRISRDEIVDLEVVGAYATWFSPITKLVTLSRSVGTHFTFQVADRDTVKLIEERVRLRTPPNEPTTPDPRG